jgi:uncharacterized protein (DUF488 family)
MRSADRTVLTIGHSTHTIERFLDLLRRHEVTAVADVRSEPYSRYAPHFSKDVLERSLRANDLHYVFLGKELGARSDDPACYDHGRVQYGRLARTAAFRAGIDRVMAGTERFRIVLLCAEKEPLDCHRTLLVSKSLEERGVAVAHILFDGRLEKHREAMLRLLDVLKIPRRDLFRSEEDLIAEALAKQEKRIAYVDESQIMEPVGEVP